MFINKNSIVINGVNMGQYLVSAKYGYNKLWSSDSGRNLAGSMSGTLIGIFPKINLQFRQLTQAELEIVVPVLDSARQTTTYYDPYKKQSVSMETYTGDYEIENNNIVGQNGHKNKGFSCSVIATKKRS